MAQSFGVNQGGVSSPFLFRAFLADMREYLNKTCGIKLDSEDELLIAHILWADDLILFAESAQELQTLIDNVYDFCSKWQLLVNGIKSKVMIFNCDTPTDQFNFTYANTNIDIVDKYKYLGVLYSSQKDTYKEHVQYAESGANRAIFSVLGYLNVLKQTPPPITLKLFDSLVLSILDYGSEIWSISTNIETLEKLQLRFYKIILGVRPQTPTPAVLGELGRYPLKIRLQCKTIKYWCKLLCKSPNCLARKAYNIMVRLHNIGFKTWATEIFNILKICNLQDSFSYPPSQEQLLKLPATVQKHLENIYLVKWTETIQTMSKLDTYCLFKSNFGLENYLFLYNKADRQSLSRFRMSAHTLEVERGRWREKDRNDRLCLYCETNSVETEKHALLQCPKHNGDRLKFYEFLEQNNTADILAAQNEDQFFLEIITCLDTGVLHALAKFVNTIFKNRLETDTTAHHN